MELYKLVKYNSIPIAGISVVHTKYFINNQRLLRKSILVNSIQVYIKIFKFRKVNIIFN